MFRSAFFDPMTAHSGRRLANRFTGGVRQGRLISTSSTADTTVTRPTNVFFRPKAAALNDEPPKSIAFGSCSSQDEDLSYWLTILDQKPDLVLLLGDNVYGGDTNESLHQAYTKLSQHEAFRAAYATTPIIAALDDNDYGGRSNNNNNDSAEQAKTMFCDFWQRSDDDERRRKGRGVYSSHTWGAELQIVMLDIRYHQNEPFRRKPKGYDDQQHEQYSQIEGPFLPNEDPSLTFLGETQWLWLQEQFKAPVKRRILGSSIQVLAVGHHWDCWNLFPRERNRLLQLVR